MAEDRLVRPAPISGFPEWLPEVRLVELAWLDRIRATFESYGFCSIETPSVEALEVLQAKGETSQEVYTLSRLQGGADAADARLGLHFDLTVPFARYVAQHFNDLVFPFKRYQIQRVWRGERPQEGRFREFTQADIDVINVDKVPLHFDAELPRVISPDPHRPRRRRVQHQHQQPQSPAGCLRRPRHRRPRRRPADRRQARQDRPDGVARLLGSELGLSAEQAKAVLDLAQIRGTDASVVDEIAALGPEERPADRGARGAGVRPGRARGPAVRQRRRRPVDRPRARLLHGHRLRGEADRRPRVRQHLLRRALREPRRLVHPARPAGRRDVDRPDPDLREDARRRAPA